MAFCALLLGWSNASAQTEWTDVTSTYITNANLKSVAANSTTNGELWPVYTSGRTGNTQHPNNWYLHTNGTTNHNGGGEFFECWAANQGVKRWTLFQNITLPAGKYKLTGQYSTNENRGIIKTVVITPHHTYFSPGIITGNWGSWGSETAEFTLYEASTTVRIGMISTNFAQNHGFTLETTGAKQLLADVISEASALSVSTTAAQAVYDSDSSTEADYRTAAKTLHDAVIEYKIAHADSSNPVDMTDYISNPSFEGVGGANPVDGNYEVAASGWTAPSVTDGKIYSATVNDYLITNNTEDGFYYLNLWNGSAITYYVKQTLTALPAGRYILSASYASDANNTASLYMGTTDNKSTITGQNKSTFVSGSVTYDLDSDGDVEIGMTSSTWMKADGFTLSYVGNPLAAARTAWNDAHEAAIAARDNVLYANVTGTERTNLITEINKTEPTTVSEYETATEALNSAKSAFTAAKTNYDVLVTEIAKAKALGIDAATADSYAATSSSTAASALGSTQNLMVAEYNYATENYATPIDLGSWTETGTNTMPATFSNEHWSGTTREYKNQNDTNGEGWNASSWSMGLDQNITLPAGDYVFKVAGRKSVDATMTLTVTNTATSAVLGTIADFPSGNSSRGINKSGATAFEGDNADFAHGGAGYGWQWRYVPFSLDEETTVNIAVTAGSSLIHNWASFGDYAVWSKPNAAASMIAYNKAVEDAGTAKTNYSQVTGSELTELNAALDADPGSTVETIDAATALIKTKTSALIAAAPSYDAYLLAKGYGDAINSTLLPYASTTKLTAVTEALETSVTSAATAVTATTAINTANRAAYESNMNAEGIAGATDRTSLIKNADGNNTAGWSGSFGTMSNEPYTDASGSSTNTYFDKNGINEFKSSQTIKLVAGTYILSVTARAQAGIDSYKLKVTNNADETEEVALTAMGNANGVFNRGWNVATVEFTQKAFGDATISIEADNTTSDANFWMSWDRFRLVSIDEEGGCPVEVTSAGYATYVSTYDLDFTSTSIKAHTAVVNTSTGVVTLNPINKVPAGTPVVLYKEGGATEDIPVAASTDAVGTNNLVAGTGATVDTGENPYNYVLDDVSGIGFYKANGVTVATNRAYLQTTYNVAGSGARGMRMVFAGDITGINEAAQAAEAAQKDGKFIENGKLVIVKNGKKYNANGTEIK